MRLFADRFLMDRSDTIDLATGDVVRLSTEASPDRATAHARSGLCDRLSALRHPLLVPLLDYGVAQDHWFEAHMPLSALRVSGAQARCAALHLGRFLSSANIVMTRDIVDRNVRPAVDSGGSTWRPVGFHLEPRASLDTIRVLLEAAGPPGVVNVEVCGVRGAGLRTMRLQAARAARLAGFLAVDGRLVSSCGEVKALCRGRHLCLIDWLPDGAGVPSVLAAAAAEGARRHVWLKFQRAPAARHAVLLERLTTACMSAMIFVDPELGPDLEDVRTAAMRSEGLPGQFIERLSALRAGRSATWVHETAPDYVVRLEAQVHVLKSPRAADSGIARLERVVVAAKGLAARGRHARAERLLRRASEALGARDAARTAAVAACDLGDLQLDRCRPEAALESFARARAWSHDTDVILRSLTGSGRAMLDEGRLPEAEAALRTALAATNREEETQEARCLLAETLAVRGDLDAARDTVLGANRASVDALALASEIERRRGHLGVAGRLAADALAAATDTEPAGVSRAHIACMRVQAILRNVEGVDRHAQAAVRAARQSRIPSLVLCAAAESHACRAACGVAESPVRRKRLLAAARRLPLLRQAQIHAAVAGIDSDVRRIASRTGALSLIEGDERRPTAVDALEKLLHITHEASDEGAALRGVAEHLLDLLSACSVTIRAADGRRQVAAAGRAWPGDTAVAERALDSGAGVFHDGAAPEAAEPIRAAGATIGCIAARWVAGASPAATRITDALRLAAAAAAPVLRMFGASAPQPPGPHPDDLLGPGPSAESVREAIRRAAMAPYPVLIEGESGAGKEIVARAIHTRSLRRARRFCAVNCAALADDLLEAELFGHTRGAFTGAVVERAGLFEDADQGTLFLDEVGELSPRAQAKLLRVLQEGEVRRVGENHARKVDARVVAATNRSLQAEVDAGRFRADLRFRVDVIRIRIPPLRERPDEVPWLATTLWAEAAQRVGTKAMLSPELISALARYDWPGNVRELQNVIAALAVHAPRRGRVAPALLPPHVAGVAGRATTSFEEARLDFERRFVRAALARAGGRKAVAARQLGVSRQGLAKMMKRLGLGDW